MVEMKATIQNDLGIHCRPSAVIIKHAAGIEGDILVRGESGSANLRSVLELISMCLYKGVQVTIRVSGPNEAHDCRELVKLFETNFDFPPRE